MMLLHHFGHCLSPTSFNTATMLLVTRLTLLLTLVDLSVAAVRSDGAEDRATSSIRNEGYIPSKKQLAQVPRPRSQNKPFDTKDVYLRSDGAPNHRSLKMMSKKSYSKKSSKKSYSKKYWFSKKSSSKKSGGKKSGGKKSKKSSKDCYYRRLNEGENNEERELHGWGSWIWLSKDYKSYSSKKSGCPVFPPADTPAPTSTSFPTSAPSSNTNNETSDLDVSKLEEFLNPDSASIRRLVEHRVLKNPYLLTEMLRVKFSDLTRIFAVSAFLSKHMTKKNLSFLFYFYSIFFQDTMDRWKRPTSSSSKLWRTKATRGSKSASANLPRRQSKRELPLKAGAPAST